MSDLIGLAGALIILVSWIIETVESVKKHKSLMDLKFSFLSIAGIFLLTIYAWQISNMIFFWLNVILGVVVIFEIWYSLHVKKVYRRAA